MLEAPHEILATIGALLLLGLLTDAIGRWTPLPRVTLLILFGVLIGPPVLDLLPIEVATWYAIFADIALLMVGFLLGGKLAWPTLRESGLRILCISVFEVLGAAAAVFCGLWLLGFDIVTCLLLAGIAPASAPAAIDDVVTSSGAKGTYTDTLLGVVAIDDAWGLILFGLLLAVAQSLGGGTIDALAYGLREVGGAVLLGVLLGLPAAYLTGRIEPGEPTQSEALGLVFLCGGLALWLEVSFILAAMVIGVIVVNLARHHRRPFREIRHLEWPFMVLFFILAGASVHLDELQEIGLLGGAYVLLRMIGLLVGAWVGGGLSSAPPAHRRWIGLALTPQAGVALGMALVAGSRFPEFQETIIAVVIGSTVIFELAGPALTKFTLWRVGELELSGKHPVARERCR